MLHPTIASGPYFPVYKKAKVKKTVNNDSGHNSEGHKWTIVFVDPAHRLSCPH